MRAGRSLFVHMLTGVAVLATTVLAGLLTANPLTSALVAVAWAGVLSHREMRSREESDID